MENDAPESGLELVLDNRRLIVAFVIFISICGCFFVLGFVEGKRQAVPDAAVVNLQASNVAGGASEGSSSEKLDWYKSVGKRGERDSKSGNKSDSASAHQPMTHEPAAGSTAPKAPAPPQTAQQPASSARTVYGIQIGVFRDRSKADAVAKRLKEKGYAYYIEPFGPGAYSLRVGKFESRAEAVAMRNRLKKDGFPSYIKAN